MTSKGCRFSVFYQTMDLNPIIQLWISLYLNDDLLLYLGIRLLLLHSLIQTWLTCLIEHALAWLGGHLCTEVLILKYHCAELKILDRLGRNLASSLGLWVDEKSCFIRVDNICFENNYERVFERVFSMARSGVMTLEYSCAHCAALKNLENIRVR